MEAAAAAPRGHLVERAGGRLEVLLNRRGRDALHDAAETERRRLTLNTLEPAQQTQAFATKPPKSSLIIALRAEPKTARVRGAEYGSVLNAEAGSLRTWLEALQAGVGNPAFFAPDREFDVGQGFEQFIEGGVTCVTSGQRHLGEPAGVGRRGHSERGDEPDGAHGHVRAHAGGE